jgi:isochorismate hydrolase
MIPSTVKRYNRSWRLQARRAALLVIDMQEYFREIAAPITANVVQLVAACRERHMPVVFTRQGNEADPESLGMLGRLWKEGIVRGSKEWRLLPELRPEPHEVVIEKTRYCAFHRTLLDELLRGRGVRDLLICGVMTNLCCETTARTATVLDYRVFFLADATATSDPALHEASLLNIAHGFGRVLETADALEAIRQRGAGDGDDPGRDTRPWRPGLGCGTSPGSRGGASPGLSRR